MYSAVMLYISIEYYASVMYTTLSVMYITLSVMYYHQLEQLMPLDDFHTLFKTVVVSADKTRSVEVLTAYHQLSEQDKFKVDLAYVAYWLPH